LRALVQRVRSARVTVGNDVVGEIGVGLCVLVGVAVSDSPDGATRLARRVANLRVFENEDGRFDRSLLDVNGGVLVVSQFTLMADSKRQKGTRPDFSKAARPEVAEPLYEHFCQALRNLAVPVETGVFGARMLVEIANDGPVTIILEI
jgi:D-tyrosyl-tRNA(Tyr) deacylase